MNNLVSEEEKEHMDSHGRALNLDASYLPLKREGLGPLFTMWLHCHNMKISTLKTPPPINTFTCRSLSLSL